MSWGDDVASSVDRTLRRALFTAAAAVLGIVIAAVDIVHHHRRSR